MKITTCLFAILLFAATTFAQAPKDLESAVQGQTAMFTEPITSSALPDNPQPQTKETENTLPKKAHILGIIPTADVTLATNNNRLTSNEKFSIFARNFFDRSTLLGAAIGAGIAQATNTPSGWGQGGEAYAQRFGSAVGEQLGSDFFKLYAFPSLFHQDPRYFRRGTGTNGNRFGYAISRVVVTRNDSGKSAFNFSRILGGLVAAAMPNAWLPEHEITAGNTLARAAGSFGADAGGFLFKEFWPNLAKKMGLKKDSKDATSTKK